MGWVGGDVARISFRSEVLNPLAYGLNPACRAMSSGPRGSPWFQKYDSREKCPFPICHISVPVGSPVGLIVSLYMLDWVHRVRYGCVGSGRGSTGMIQAHMGWMEAVWGPILVLGDERRRCRAHSGLQPAPHYSSGPQGPKVSHHWCKCLQHPIPNDHLQLCQLGGGA